MTIYLDYHSTTPCDPRVVDAMLPYFTQHYGNPSAIHSIGEFAKDAVDISRQSIADTIHAPSNCIYFTSGATEANNIVLRSALNFPYRIERDIRRPCVITTNSEHSSVYDTLQSLFLEDKIDIEYLKIDREGNLNTNDLENLLASDKNIVLVSIIAANNEIGTIHDLKRIGELCKKYGIMFHTDATQAVGKIPIDVNEMNIDALSMSAHKIYGPKGIGAVYLRDKDFFYCLITGGRQEHITSGTTNVPCVVGFARACELMQEEISEADRIKKLRDKFIRDLKNKVKLLQINGTMNNRLYNNINITVPNVPAEILVMGMSDVCISTGSACLSRMPKPSRVISALGVDNPECAVRISLGRWTTEQEIEFAVQRMSAIINEVRK